MRPKGKHPSTGELFQQPLAELIDWSVFETRWADSFLPALGVRPARRD